MNPFRAVVDTVKLEFELPGLAMIVVGDTAMLKSGPGSTVNVSAAEWLSEPEVPVTVIGNFPADAGRESVTVWFLLTGMLKGDAGLVVAPAGKPEIATVTVPVNPFALVVDTVNFELELPACVVIVAGDTLIAKS